MCNDIGDVTIISTTESTDTVDSNEDYDGEEDEDESDSSSANNIEKFSWIKFSIAVVILIEKYLFAEINY